MDKTTYIVTVLEKILEKTRVGRLIWSEQTQGSSTVIVAELPPDMAALFRLRAVDPFNAEWQRFSLLQSGKEMVQVFNPDIVKVSAQGQVIERVLPQINALFDIVAIQPRQQRLKESLEFLDRL